MCPCHGVPWRWNPDRRMTAGGRLICAVRARERQAVYARAKRASSVEYVVTQRRGKLRRLRGQVLVQLGQLHEEARILGS